MKPRVVLCCPTIDRPSDAWLLALEASVPLLDERYEHAIVHEIGSPYISAARAGMLRKALLRGADMVVFLDDDVSWQPEDLITLIEAEGDVVAATYRFKMDEERYMGHIKVGPSGKPMVRDTDGAIVGLLAPAGFLKVTRAAAERFLEAYPELTMCADNDGFKSPDLFHQGVMPDGVWWGEDYAFSKRWVEAGGELWILPKLRINHHAGAYSRRRTLIDRIRRRFPRLGRAGRVYRGCLHDQLMRPKLGVSK